MKTFTNPHDALKHHVTGAIERGEKQPIVALIHTPGDTYTVTGLLYNSTKRFRHSYSNPMHALGINLWRGSVWQQKFGKGRTLIKRVFN